MAYRWFSHLPYCLIFRDKMHVEWVNAYVSIWTELQAYIKQHHTTGLSWSKTVSHALVCSVWPTWSINGFPKYLSILVLQGPVASASGGAPSGGAPAPPPPGPPPPMDLGKSSGGDSGPTSRNALFASLNKGADITRGMKWILNLEYYKRAWCCLGK